MENQKPTRVYDKLQDPRKIELCKLIRHRIRVNAWRQKDAAMKAGIHETAISNVCWRDGERYSVRWVLNLCRKLGIDEQRINEAMRVE